VLRLTVEQPEGPRQLERSTVIHIHAHYQNELRGILRRIPEDFSGTLVITGSDERTLESAEEALTQRPFRSAVRWLPNRGRNFGGLQEVLASDDEFEFVLHLHTKRTPSHSSRVVQRWTSFLHANLLGHDDDPLGSLRRTLAAFETDPRIGLAFPSDPHVLGWGANLPHATSIVSDPIAASLPASFDFPIGGMFLARRSALEFLAGLPDFPPEPIPYDGSMLHAIERLMGIVPAIDWDVLHTAAPPFTR
jgi:lipopolysaccharide biosynthesis protein